MKKHYYELQVLNLDDNYVTVMSYVGLRSNANRKFRRFISENDIAYYQFRVKTYETLRSKIVGLAATLILSFKP